MLTLRAVLLLLSLVAPGAEHTGAAYPFAVAVRLIASVGAAALLVTLYEEGRFCSSCARGDGGRSVCSGQVWASTPARARELETSVVACVRAAYWVMREGARICPAAPLAPYCGGCSGKASRAIGLRREDHARRMVAQLATVGP